MGDLEPRPAPPAAAVPPPRASDADRERTAELLRRAGGRGQLDVDELDERLTAAFAARTRADLVPLTADLPEDEHGTEAVSLAKGPVVRPGPGGDRWVVAVMSGNDRSGHWRVGAGMRVVNVMGGSEIDLTQAELTGAVTHITVVSVMGGCELRVPDGVRVEVTKVGIMGGNDVRLGPDRPAPDAPLIRLRLIGVMGGNTVERGPKQTREERRLARRERHAEKHLARHHGER